MLAALAQPPVWPSSDLRCSTQLSGLEPSEASSHVSSLSLCVGPGRKEPAACSGWWAGDRRAGAGCRCLSEGPACGSGRCAVLVAAHAALSSPSSALLCPAGSDNAPARGREVFCFCHCHCLCPRVLPLTRLSLFLNAGERENTETLLVISSAVFLSGPGVLTSASCGRSPVGLPLGWLECFKGEGQGGGKAVEVKGMCTLVRMECSPPFSGGREWCTGWMGLCGKGVNSKRKMGEQNRACPLSLRS